ncbi:MAG TPA: methylornithine synthase PylB [Coriobacteriia bacterium]|nr:methylornithine synthase PylB [Coriobacteriia bacterium]
MIKDAGYKREKLGKILTLLKQSDGREKLFALAREARDEFFGREVFAYGFNYFSTYCKNNCSFCNYRIDNRKILRYRNSHEQVVADAKRLADSGVHLIDLTMGEDPHFKNHPTRLVDLISAVYTATGLPIMISPGLVDERYLVDFRQAGAVWLALYQETFLPDAYKKLRLEQNFAQRLNFKRAALSAGLLVEEGILTGWGDGFGEALTSLLQIDQVNPTQLRMMTFVPQDGIPLAGGKPDSFEREPVLIAIMRLLYPHKLIPASLDVEGPAGLKSRLDAGANIITSIIPPNSGLFGVARSGDIESGLRSLEQIKPIIENSGLRLASVAAYKEFIDRALKAQADARRTAMPEAV